MTVLDGLSAIAQWVFINSIKASVLIALILLIQRVARDRLPAKWLHALWLILITRLLLPAGLETDFSLYNLFDRSDTVVSTSAQLITQPIWSEAMQATPMANETQSHLSFSLVDIFSGIWLLGSLIFSGLAMLGNTKCWKQIKQRKSISDTALLALHHDCLKQMQIDRKVSLATLDKIQIPMLYGYFKPVILLPESQIKNFSHDQIRHIICHELAHLKRHDILIAHITTVLQILHWFNPLMWLAFYKIRLDREIACDAIALNHLGREQSKSYGATIVSLLENISTENLLPMTVGIVESKKNLKRRLISITKFKKPRVAWTVLGLTVALLLGCGALTEAKKTKQSTGENPDKLSKSFHKAVKPDFFTQNNRVMFKSKNKEGYRNRKGNVVIEPIFEKAGPFVGGRYAAVKLNGKWGYIDTTGAWLVKPQFDMAQEFHDDMAVVRVEEKHGYINLKGELVIEPQFEVAYPFTEDRAIVRKNDRSGFIDKTGKMIVNYQYEQANIFVNGMAAVQKNDRWGFIDTSGKIVIPFMYDQTEAFSEGLAAVRKNGKFGYINVRNEFEIPLQFMEADHFSEGLAAVKLPNQKFGFIDKTGQIVIEAQYDMVVVPFEEGTAGVLIFEDPETGVMGKSLRIDRKGNVIKDKNAFDLETTKKEKNQSNLNQNKQKNRLKTSAQNSNFSIILDPGHGTDPGAHLPNGLKEKDLNLKIANRLAKILRSKGIEVNFTRSDDRFVYLAERKKRIESSESDLALSIHINFDKDTTSNGIRFFYEEDNKSSLDFSQALNENLAKNQKMKSDEPETEKFFIIKNAAIPTVLIEAGYMSHKSDLKALNDPAFIEDFCERVSGSIITYLETRS